jgi:hypothetical protein
MSRIGIAVSGGPNPADIVDLVVLAESLGYESAWVAEGHGGDQFAILAACAMRTSRIRLGTSISSVFVRTRARIEAYRESGIDLPIISPFARGPDAKTRFEAAIRACAPTAR